MFRALYFKYLEITSSIRYRAYLLFSSLKEGGRAYNALWHRWSPSGLQGPVVSFLSWGLSVSVGGLLFLTLLAMPSLEEVDSKNWKYLNEFSVVFLDISGKEIGRRGVKADDTYALSDIPPYLIHAVLATEDKRFYHHFGLDFIGIFRAFVENIRAGGVRQGGSSLSQQLAKLLFLSNERTLRRKVKEAFLALWLEINLTKNEILKLYLDRAYMGAGLIGIAAAADFYFDKSVKDLTLSESAMLAGLFKAPSSYAPHVNLSAARIRANQVLLNMVNAGFLTKGQYMVALQQPASAIPHKSDISVDYFLDWAFQEIKHIAPKGKRVLIARTTLDLELHNAAKRVVRSFIKNYGRGYRVEQAALASVQLDGAVKALVGGVDYGLSQFNRATDAIRQPGSSFKPFVYIAAFLKGYTPKSVVSDRPITIGGWSPRNYGRSYRGRTTIKVALTKSINTIPVRLAQAIGRGIIVEKAREMGLTTPLPITRALPLGVADVRVIDMAGAYNAFANGGFYTRPYAILQLKTPQGEVLWTHPSFSSDQKAQYKRILPADKVAFMNQILVNVVEAGTGRRAQLARMMSAGKTGTTQDYRDGWFVGYTPYFTTAVWAGNDNFSKTNRMTGGSLPAMIWKAYMEEAHKNLPYRPIIGIPEGSVWRFRGQSAPKDILQANNKNDDIPRPSFLPPELHLRTQKFKQQGLSSQLRALLQEISDLVSKSSTAPAA